MDHSGGSTVGQMVLGHLVLVGIGDGAIVCICCIGLWRAFSVCGNGLGVPRIYQLTSTAIIMENNNIAKRILVALALLMAGLMSRGNGADGFTNKKPLEMLGIALVIAVVASLLGVVLGQRQTDDGR
jgi:hypothetical protein